MTTKETLVLRAMGTDNEELLMRALRALEGADAEPMITAAEGARRLGISLVTFRRRRFKPAARFGRAIRYRWSELVSAGD